MIKCIFHFTNVPHVVVQTTDEISGWILIGRSGNRNTFGSTFFFLNVLMGVQGGCRQRVTLFEASYVYIHILYIHI